MSDKKFLEGLLGSENYDDNAIRGLLGIAAGALSPGVNTTGQAVGAGLMGGLSQVDAARQQQAAAQKAKLEAEYRQAQMAKMAQDMKKPIMAPPGTQLRDPNDPSKLIGTTPFKPQRGFAPPEIAKLVEQMNSMSPNDPRRKFYQDRINKLTTQSSGVTVNLPSPDTKAYEAAGNTYDNAQSRYENSALMLEMMDQGLGTSAIAPLTTQLSGYVEGITGVRLKEDAPASEAFRALSNQAALRLRNPASGLGLTGNTSDRDVKFLKDSVAGLGATPEANRILLMVEMAKARRQMALAEAKQEHIDEVGGLRGWSRKRKAIVDAEPLFSDEEKARIKALAESGKKPSAPAAGNDDDSLINKYIGK